MEKNLQRRSRDGGIFRSREGADTRGCIDAGSSRDSRVALQLTETITILRELLADKKIVPT